MVRCQEAAEWMRGFADSIVLQLHGTRMIHLGMTTFVDELGPQPLFGHTIDGNQNGRTAVAEGLPLLQKHLRLNDTVMISDRGTFSSVHLGRVQRAGMHALCSVPWDDVKELFDKQRKNLKWKKASYLSQEQQRRRRQGNLPKEHYELAVASHEMTDTATKEKIPVRVIFVYSTADRKAVRKQRTRQIEKIREGLEKVQATVARGGSSPSLASLYADAECANAAACGFCPRGPHPARRRT